MNNEFNDLLILKHNVNSRDEIGNRIQIPVERKVLVNVRSATRQEVYSEANHDFRPEYVVRMNKVEYEDESDCVFREKDYKITRVFEDFDSYDLLELTLSRKINQNEA